jgi:hypothetical protein
MSFIEEVEHAFVSLVIHMMNVRATGIGAAIPLSVNVVSIYGQQIAAEVNSIQLCESDPGSWRSSS